MEDAATDETSPELRGYPGQRRDRFASPNIRAAQMTIVSGLSRTPFRLSRGVPTQTGAKTFTELRPELVVAASDPPGVRGEARVILPILHSRWPSLVTVIWNQSPTIIQ